ncbi:hydroxylamine reductase (plasmid) [Methylocystis sp. MJC1]|jgi:hydroxylamine reductase|uniref:hydroxylamine reductase n=1 Tax=Methylocystis sp. MJC1 TaxID=2654282 RepID=UPI0013EBB4AC|nr:hydroxylamine reductase [Methylocystis sp. MJC1]KAF2991533.1 Hydroxylamine reductase [Methylocystis sp. MJC1]MBU6529155.1 hydroxylamine reductase [Methylocystis sp. MJC1]UZX13838.1 hydroxylamine reductase [Methylocystis sp. MJC1]
MFCYQCEQTYRSDEGAGCAGAKGMCGKDAATADLQDILLYVCEGIGQYLHRARGLGARDIEADRFILFAFFTTLTNVNFNSMKFVELIQQASLTRDRAKALYEKASFAACKYPETLSGAAAFVPAKDMSSLLAQASEAAVRKGAEVFGEDIVGLRSLILYGLKGICAYAYHARVLGQERDAIYEAIEHALDVLARRESDISALLDEALSIGRANFIAMEALDAANTGTFGAPAPTSVRVTPIKGKAILVSGHDLKDLHAILEATKDKGINVYTHGELLPAHSYPKLKAYLHLVGNYGGAWQDQQKEFAEFPGPVVMTSNCLIEPQPRYRGRIFTAGPVGWAGVRHIANEDFSIVVQAAQALPGFAEDAPVKTITIGFGRDTVLGVADKVIDAVKAGAIRHFFLIGGCDGAAPGRNYYSEFADEAPKDTVILTIGCGKYRFNKHDLGTIGGLPRLLDMGQCNDAYSALIVATKLAEAFGVGVNELPLSLIVSWFEQKAAAVLLTLLALGVRNVRLGPTLPAFLTPALVDVLVEKFGIQPVGEAKADIEASLSRAA